MPSLSDTQRELLLAELSGLRGFCYSLTSNHADADDLLQITVERVLAKGMPAEAHAGKWAYRVCKNAWIDELRSRDVRQKYPQLVEEQSDVAHSAEHLAGSDQEFNAVAIALDSLPAEQRIALSLVAIDGRTYAEAAEVLEVPIGTIMSRVARARRNLVAVYGPANDDQGQKLD